MFMGRGSCACRAGRIQASSRCTRFAAQNAAKAGEGSISSTASSGQPIAKLERDQAVGALLDHADEALRGVDGGQHGRLRDGVGTVIGLHAEP
jgi:hypothetical protein